MEKNISQNWGSVSGAHLGVLDSADVQGCRGRLIWIRTGSSGYGDLGIREKQTNISVDVNLLTISGGQSTQIKYLSKSTDTYSKILLQ